MTMQRAPIPTAVVTGGSTHIGRAIAETLAANSYQVYIASRDVHRCVQVAAEITSSHGPCRGLPVDVTNRDALDRLFRQSIEETGRLDVVVCNAGGNALLSPSTSEEVHVEETIRVNLIGSYLTALEAYRYMSDHRTGAIVLIGSIHGLVGSDARLYQSLRGFTRSGPEYHAAKGGVVQLTRSLAAEYGSHGVRVNCVSPGIIDGPGIPAELAGRVADRTPLARIGTAEEVAAVVRFLSGPDASWVTGQNIVVDGGWTVW